MNNNFFYNENISIKGIEPLLNNNLVSSYFYNLYKPVLNNAMIKELDKILEYSNKTNEIKKNINTINKESWLKYRIANNIAFKNLNETIIKINSSIKDKNNDIFINYIQNGKNKNLYFNDKNLYYKNNKPKAKPLWKTNKALNNKVENILYLHKECYCQNDYEFLYMLLNCLFSSNNNYYIKKCERCNRYFLATIPNKKMCSRPRTICGKETICCNASKIFYKSKEYKYMFRLVEKHLKPYYNGINDNSEYINSIRDTFTNIKEKCILEDKYDRIKESIKETEDLVNN